LIDREHDVAVYRYAGAEHVTCVSNPLHKFAVGIKERKFVAVADNEFSKRGARDSLRKPAKNAVADVAHKRAVHIKNGDALMHVIRDSDATVAVSVSASMMYAMR
jgi:hypothetical protein